MAANKPHKTSYTGLHPKRLMMYIYLISTMMIFAGLTSAVMVSRADFVNQPGGWADFYDLPEMFTWTTILVVLSSVVLQWGFWAASRDKIRQLQVSIALTLLMGIGFLVGQFYGFVELVDKGVYLVGTSNPSGSFLYVITLVHGLHLVAAVIVLIVIMVQTFLNKIHRKNILGFELSVTFWHALGFLWVYLFLFLQVLYD